MKAILSEISTVRQSVISGIAFFLTVASFSLAYAAYSTLTASPAETLTKDKWNEMLQYVVPPGAIMAFNGTSCPSWWDLADGTNDPAVGGGTNPMDLRGRFPRGTNGTSANDPDFASRSGWMGTAKIGSTQGDEVKSHSHPAHPSCIGCWAPGGSYAINYSNTSAGWSLNTGTSGGNETRPKNVAVLYCIKQ